MKKLLFGIPFFAVSLFLAHNASADGLTAGNLSFAGTTANSGYAISHSTISPSSGTVAGVASFASIPAVSGFRKAFIQLEPSLTQMQSGASVYFSLDGSTSSIFTDGYVVKFSTAEFPNVTTPKIYNVEMESNKAIYMQVPSGQTAVNGRYTEFRKNN